MLDENGIVSVPLKGEGLLPSIFWCSEVGLWHKEML